MSQLTPQQIKENEKYFLNTLNTLREGGVFGWIGMGENCIKKNGKLVCAKKSYDTAKRIVSDTFFKKYFELKK